jgi:glycine cleavage system H protein
MSLITIKIDNCSFPTNYLYDIQNFTWADFNYNNVEKDFSNGYTIVKVGIMPILSYIAGNIRKIKLKQTGDTVIQGKSIGTIESMSYFGVIRSPVSGKIIEINSDLLSNPKRVNDSPFESGWIAKIKTLDSKNIESLQSIDQCKIELSKLIKKFNVKCFKNYPDFEMFELGTECSATLAKLDDFMDKKMGVGQIVHLVSDDPTADLEVSRWTDENKQELLEIIMEKNNLRSNITNYLFHILIKKLNQTKTFTIK